MTLQVRDGCQSLDVLGISGIFLINLTLLNLIDPLLLQGEAATLTDRYGVAIGLPIATAMLLKKQIQYRYSHGIGLQISYMLCSVIPSFP